jgi:hypothetical protein
LLYQEQTIIQSRPEEPEINVRLFFATNQGGAFNHSNALDKATDANGTVNIPDGNYGPVPVMMDAMLLLGQSGLLEGALESNSQTPYSLNPANPLLFFQDDVLATGADTLDLTGPQWGIEHETGNFPGAWWLFPHAIWYHIPPMSTSSNGDIVVGAIMIVLFLVLLPLPLIPGLNHIPQGVKVYRLIWRDWYQRKKSTG